MNLNLDKIKILLFVPCSFHQNRMFSSITAVKNKTNIAGPGSAQPGKVVRLKLLESKAKPRTSFKLGFRLGCEIREI